MAQGKPARLYVYEFNGEAPAWVTPGLSNCKPNEDQDFRTANPLFVALPEANFSEGSYSSESDVRRRSAAVDFGSAYNMTMFRQRLSEIVKVCPHVKESK